MDYIKNQNCGVPIRGQDWLKKGDPSIWFGSFSPSITLRAGYAQGWVRSPWVAQDARGQHLAIWVEFIRRSPIYPSSFKQISTDKLHGFCFGRKRHTKHKGSSANLVFSVKAASKAKSISICVNTYGLY